MCSAIKLDAVKRPLSSFITRRAGRCPLLDPYVATGEISGADESSLTAEEPFLLGGLSSTIGQGMPWLVASDTLTATCDRTACDRGSTTLSVYTKYVSNEQLWRAAHRTEELPLFWPWL